MRAPLEVRFEKLQKLIERISEESQRGRVIVVEGNRDRESLRSMGVTGTILCLKSGRSNTVGFAERLDGEEEVILLTDFDREGVFLAKQLARLLNSQSIHPNLLLWRQLRRPDQIRPPKYRGIAEVIRTTSLRAQLSSLRY